MLSNWTLVSIGELNKFITNCDEQVKFLELDKFRLCLDFKVELLNNKYTVMVKTQEVDFICKARVVEVLEQNGWSFVSCTGCSKKLDKSGSSLHCNCCAIPTSQEL